MTTLLPSIHSLRTSFSNKIFELTLSLEIVSQKSFIIFSGQSTPTISK